jgi:hypothetical protein
MRCTNAGSSYDDADVEWSCTANLPQEFKLGSTDVICEGYSSSEDPYVLKGSCGVEYRLVLTELGEEKYGTGWFSKGDGSKLKGKLQVETKTDTIVTTLFWLLFVGVAVWMLYSYCTQMARRAQGGAFPRPPRGPGGGGGGGGFWPGNDDPPPPYDYQPPRGKPSYPRSSSQGWRPGFWTGAGAGATAGYAAGRAGRRTDSAPTAGRRGLWDNAGEGSSRGSSSSSPSSARYTSTGFGSTTRR